MKSRILNDKKHFIPLVWISCALVSGCQNPADSMVAGAATGAAMGGLLKGTGRGMAQGAAIGAAGGYVLGKYGEAERQRGYAQASGYPPPPPPPVYMSGAYYVEPPPAYQPPYGYHSHRPHSRGFLYARSSSRYGYVYSPYGDRLLVDVRGCPRGGHVRDPQTGLIFIIP